jgi:hypothetical protein
LLISMLRCRICQQLRQAIADFARVANPVDRHAILQSGESGALPRPPAQVVGPGADADVHSATSSERSRDPYSRSRVTPTLTENCRAHSNLQDMDLSNESSSMLLSVGSLSHTLAHTMDYALVDTVAETGHSGTFGVFAADRRRGAMRRKRIRSLPPKSVVLMDEVPTRRRRIRSPPPPKSVIPTRQRKGATDSIDIHASPAATQLRALPHATLPKMLGLFQKADLAWPFVNPPVPSIQVAIFLATGHPKFSAIMLLSQ